jgi:hypothetical protein
MAPTNPADTNVPDADDKDEDSDAAEALRNAGVSDAEIEAAIAAIRVQKADDLPRRPYPSLPNLAAGAPMSAKIAAMQAYIEKLSYNFTGVDYFDVRKHRAVSRILDTGRQVTKQALPIKCVEAVFVAISLTQGLRELERVPFSFRSQVGGITYKHIVLALKHENKWGSVGLSRRRELYYKDLVYDSLAELLLEYKRSYERVFHTLRRVKVGLPVPHEQDAREPICWGYISVKCIDVANATHAVASFGRNTQKLSEKWKADCEKAKKLGANPPLPPYQQKKLEARKAKDSGLVASTTRAELSDSSEEERAAADVAEAEAAEQDAGDAPAQTTADAMHNAEDRMAAIRAEDTQPNRPSFLAV